MEAITPSKRNESIRIIEKTMFRLLPVQIVLASIATVNGIVSGLFASNIIGANAMGAVMLYDPFTKLIQAFIMVLNAGSAVVVGRYMGRNEREKIQSVFSLVLLLSIIIGAVFSLIIFAIGSFSLTGIFTPDLAVRKEFDLYLMGQAAGIIPLIVGSQFTVFLSLENKMKRTVTASIVCIAVNAAFNVVFLIGFKMGTLGLALATAIGQWAFMLIQAEYFASEKSDLNLSVRNPSFADTGEIIKVGIPGGLSSGYQMIRGLIVNSLVVTFVGTLGLSAFGACNSFLGPVWGIPFGMVAVSRMMMSISEGEEDRQSLTDIMRVVFKRFIPLMMAVSLLIIILAKPLTCLFYRDPADPVFDMTVSGFRILPLCMPLSIICMHFVCYGTVSGKTVYVQVLSLIDGLLGVAGFTWLLIGIMGMNSVYVANVLNGVATTVYIIAYAWQQRKHFPRNMDDLMVIPEDFGVSEDERIDISIDSIEEVVNLAERVQDFCSERGIDEKHAYMAGLAMEEMAGNVVDHGFTKDNKRHSIDIRVVHREDKIILRIRDDCVMFNPMERAKLTDLSDPEDNMGIRMILKIAEEVEYQSILGMNVLTIRI